MDSGDFGKLVEDVEEVVLAGVTDLAILGATPTTLRLLEALDRPGVRLRPPVYCAPEQAKALGFQPFESLREADHTVLVVAADDDKEDILTAALPFIQGAPRVLVAGYGHLKFRDPIFEAELAELLVPSLANGYPNTLIHLFQCLQNAARLGVDGSVAEFGTFKGGTTMFLARVIKRLGRSWPVVTFDTFEGFPARRSALDMYDHPDCVFTDIAAVRRYFDGWDIELVSDDIVDSAPRLAGIPLVLSFIDTDNYSSARAALDVVSEETVVGGAIVFDHFTGVDRFRYTLGERMAGKVLLEDARYLHLHGTGVFYRQA